MGKAKGWKSWMAEPKGWKSAMGRAKSPHQGVVKHRLSSVVAPDSVTTRINPPLSPAEREQRYRQALQQLRNPRPSPRQRSMIDHGIGVIAYGVRVSAYGISHQWLRRPRKRLRSGPGHLVFSV
jgi:hypothetical protein